LVILLYALASGLSLQETARPGGMSQHGMAGILGTALCAIGIVLLARRRTP